CGPCSTACIDRLMNEGDYDITVFYYNPCINDREEYEKRKQNQIMYINAINDDGRYGGRKVSFVEGDYFPEEYLELVKGFENEPEGGRRCTICFTQRLRAAASYALGHGYDCFTTTLTVSPYKNYPLISSIGKKTADELGIRYLDMDFKKKAGFEKSVKLSKAYGLYRQNYCGCDFSKRTGGGAAEPERPAASKDDGHSVDTDAVL
ncbi:MAG: epoxyqueuosine reductase QueH, partial [Anaerovoracaceae bacterium]